MKNICIIQARMSSTRLPGKVLKRINGSTLLEYQIQRLRFSKRLDKIVVATTNQKADNQIQELCQKIGIGCFRGSEDDVLDRYYQCSLRYPEYKNIVRVTGDCPLIDPVLVDQVIDLFEKQGLDFASNVEPPTFPDGLDVEVFKAYALKKVAGTAKLWSEREHVTQPFKENPKNKKGNIACDKDYSGFRLTVDEPEDFELVKFIIKNSRPDAGYLDYINLLLANPDIASKNKHFIRNEGLAKSKAQDKIYEKEL